MKISRVLRFNSFAVLSLLILNIAVTLFLIQRIVNSTKNLNDVQKPLEEAILEMEVNVGESARALFDYISYFRDEDYDKLVDSMENFERHAKEFERLADTEEQRLFGKQLDTLYQNFKNLAEGTLTISKRQFDDLTLFRKNITNMDVIMDEQFQPAIDRSSPFALTKLEAALEMEINVNEAFAALEGYALLPDPELRLKFLDSKEDYERFEKQYRGTPLSSSEKKWFDQIDAGYTEALNKGMEILTLSDQSEESLTKFDDSLEEIDNILDEDIQILIKSQTIRRVEEAQRIAFIVMIFSGLLIFAIVAVMGRSVSKKIMDVVRRLVEGVVEFGREDFDKRSEEWTEDELLELAGAFNEMAKERKAAQEKLQESEEKFRTLTVRSPVGVFLDNEDGKASYINDKFSDLVGLPPEKILNSDWVEHIHPDDRERVRKEREQAYNNGGEFHSEYRWVHADGKVVWTLGDVVPVRGADADSTTFIGTLTDITQRMEAEVALKEANNSLEEMVFITSHDLQVPLISLEGFTSNVLDNYRDKLDERGIHQLERIKSNAQRMHRLVLSLLDLSRLATKKNPIVSIDTNKLAKDVIGDLSLTIEKAGVKIKIDKIPKINGDKQRIEGVFKNLLTNAILYGGTNLEIGFEDGAFFVKDDGIGIDSDQLEKIFKPGERIKDIKTDGSGMGLTFSKKVIEQHGGKLWAESEGKGKGSTFRFTVK